MRYPGRLLKNRTPPTVDRRGVPVGLSILLLIMFVCFCFGEEEQSVHFLFDRKTNDKTLENTVLGR